MVTDGVVRVDYVNGCDNSAGLITSLRTFNQTGTIYTRPGYDDVTGVGTPNIDNLGSGGGSGSGGPSGPGGGSPVRGAPVR